MSLIDKLQNDPDQPGLCYKKGSNVTLVEFQPGPHERWILPVAQLARAVWEDITPHAPAGYAGAPERWRLAFATTDVVISGWRLDKLVTLLHEHQLAVVRPVPGRPDYSKTSPFIASMQITPLDEERPETPPAEDDGGNNAPLPLPPDRERSGSVLHRHVR